MSHRITIRRKDAPASAAPVLVRDLDAEDEETLEAFDSPEAFLKDTLSNVCEIFGLEASEHKIDLLEI